MSNSAEKYSNCSQRLPVFGSGFVLISHADSKQQFCSNTDAACLSNRHQLYRHFKTLGSIFEAKLVPTIYTLTLVAIELKYAALAHDAKLNVL